MARFKVGDCIRDDYYFGEVINVQNGESYLIQWYDGRPEITSEGVESIDLSFRKINRFELVALAI